MKSENTVPRGAADLPLKERERIMRAQEQENREGVRNRHFAITLERHLRKEAQFAQLMRVAPVLVSAFDGIGQR